jgi:diguanylate cyclase (GGDEF)-like protein
MRLMRHRYLLAFLSAAAILALVGVAIMLGTQRYREDARLVVHTMEVLGTMEAAHADLLRAVASQRSYLLTDDPTYRDLHATARESASERLAALARLVADNPVQTARTRDLARLVRHRLELASEAIDLYEREGLEASRTFARTNRSLETSLAIEQASAQLEGEERSLLRIRRDAAEQSATAALVLGAVGIPLSLGILGWVYVLLSREVRERAHAEERATGLNAELEGGVARLERSSEELRQLSRYASLLQTCRNVPEALDVTRRVMSVLMPTVGGTVFLTRSSQDYAEAEAGWGKHAVPSQAMLMPTDCWALRRAQPHCVDDVHDGVTCAHQELPPPGEPASSACLPLSAQGTSLGFLYLSAPGRASLPISIASTAAEQLSLALTNLRLQETLRQQSIRDALTGLYNRRYLEESLPREIARSERRGQSLALLMIDLDHFKAFNDKHGHDGGDAVLAAFGHLLQASSRGEDIACRYGGEEFTLILTEITPEDARRRAEELRAAVERMHVRHLQRDLGDVTASIGLAMFPDDAQDAGALHRKADAALYRAKHAGRNRVELAATS